VGAQRSLSVVSGLAPAAGFWLAEAVAGRVSTLLTGSGIGDAVSGLRFGRFDGAAALRMSSCLAGSQLDGPVERGRRPLVVRHVHAGALDRRSDGQGGRRYHASPATLSPVTVTESQIETGSGKPFFRSLLN
jgi:hypothetical protein